MKMKEGLTLETLVFEFFNGGEFTLSTLWLIIYLSISLSQRRSTQFLSKLNPPILIFIPLLFFVLLHLGVWPAMDVSHGMTHAALRNATNQRLWIRGQTAHIQELLIYEYTDWSNVDDVNVTRQRFIDINTDATFKAPAVLSAKAFVKKQLPTYFYQVEKAPEWFLGFQIPSWLGVLHGADLVYIFGYPLVTPRNLTSAADVQLSKNMMTFWTNFAKSG